MSRTEPYDCLIVGGGPAGLAAGTYLARFRRRALLVHDGQPRARWIPRTRNVPGYPHGIEGAELLARLQEQAARYGVERVAARVTTIDGHSGSFRVHADGPPLHARRIVLATGVHDLVPDELRFLWPLVSRGLVRLCPVCDAFELCGRRIGLLAHGERAAREAEFLAAYSRSVTLFSHGEHLSGAVQARIVSATPSGAGVTIGLEGGAAHELDALYVGLGVEAYSGLAARLGARCDPDGYLLTDARQQTSVAGIYAAGDVVQSLSQISVAFGQAAIAASAINLALNEEGLRAAPPETARGAPPS